MSKNVILYARVSTQKQSTQWESLNVQIDEMRRYSKFQNWNILEEFQEQFTGTKDSRPEFNRALEKIKFYRKAWIQVDYFLVTKIDRNTRGGIDVHNSIKNKLIELWVQLKDTQWVIQDRKNVVQIEWVDTSAYGWSYQNPSEVSELFFASTAKHERDAILQRTIPQEIRNTYEWYWVRPPNFWYNTQATINESGARKTIQVPHPIESKWIIRIFEMKAAWYSDYEIAEEVNAMWYTSRDYILWDSTKTKAIWKKGWKKLDIKQLQVYLMNPIYAGVAKIQWKWNPIHYIRQKYKWLISIDLWNRANSGKRKIIINGDTVTLSSGSDDPEDILVKKRRNRLHPDFPFWKLILADGTDRFLNYNSPKWRRERYRYYSARGSKNYPVEEFEQSVVDYFNEIGWEESWGNFLDCIVWLAYKYRKDEFVSATSHKEEHLKTLQMKRNTIISNLDNYSELPEILSIKEAELKTLKNEIMELEKEVVSVKSDIDISTIKDFWKMITEHLWTLASATRNYETLKIIFWFTLGYTPEYSEILNRTARLRPFLALNTKKHTLADMDFVSIEDNMSRWQPHLESNQGPRLWRPVH